MNSNPIRNGPVFEGPYVPYLYQAGLYRFPILFGPRVAGRRQVALGSDEHRESSGS